MQAIGASARAEGDRLDYVTLDSRTAILSAGPAKGVDGLVEQFGSRDDT